MFRRHWYNYLQARKGKLRGLPGQAKAVKENTSPIAGDLARMRPAFGQAVS